MSEKISQCPKKNLKTLKKSGELLLKTNFKKTTRKSGSLESTSNEGWLLHNSVCWFEEKQKTLKGKFFLPLELRGFPHHPKYVDME